MQHINRHRWEQHILAVLAQQVAVEINRMCCVCDGPMHGEPGVMCQDCSTANSTLPEIDLAALVPHGDGDQQSRGG